MVYSWKGCSFSECYGGVRNSDGKIQKEAKFIFMRKNIGKVWRKSGNEERMLVEKCLNVTRVLLVPEEGFCRDEREKTTSGREELG